MTKPVRTATTTFKNIPMKTFTPIATNNNPLNNHNLHVTNNLNNYNVRNYSTEMAKLLSSSTAKTLPDSTFEIYQLIKKDLTNYHSLMFVTGVEAQQFFSEYTTLAIKEQRPCSLLNFQDINFLEKKFGILYGTKHTRPL